MNPRFTKEQLDALPRGVRSRQAAPRPVRAALLPSASSPAQLLRASRTTSRCYRRSCRAASGTACRCSWSGRSSIWCVRVPARHRDRRSGATRGSTAGRRSLVFCADLGARLLPLATSRSSSSSGRFEVRRDRDADVRDDASALWRRSSWTGPGTSSSRRPRPRRRASPTCSRYVRSQMLEVISSDYVAHRPRQGLPRGRVPTGTRSGTGSCRSSRCWGS